MQNSDPIARDQMSIGKELNWVNKVVLIHSSPSTMICAEQIGRFETRQHVEGVGTTEVKAGHPLSELLIPKNTAPEAMLDTSFTGSLALIGQTSLQSRRNENVKAPIAHFAPMQMQHRRGSFLAGASPARRSSLRGDVRALCVFCLAASS